MPRQRPDASEPRGLEDHVPDVQRHTDAVQRLVRENQIAATIAVHVGDLDARRRAATGGEIRGAVEGSITVADVERDVLALRRHEIVDAVTVQIRERHVDHSAKRLGDEREILCKGARAEVFKAVDPRAGAVRCEDEDVEITVDIDVDELNRMREVLDAEVRRIDEVAATGVEQHGGEATAVVGSDDVIQPIFIEIADREIARARVQRLNELKPVRGVEQHREHRVVP
jgi:hypothetical protein